jgi:hypothetical protein
MFLTLAGKNITETKPDDAKTRLVVVAAQFNPTRRARFFRARPLFFGA